MPLYGSSIASMLQSYVESMNNGNFPTIKTAWQHISDDEGAFAYNRALENYNYLYEENFSSDEPKGDEIHKVLRELRDSTLSEYNRNLSQPNEAYEKKLKQFLSEKEDAILEINKQLNECKNAQILKDLAMPLMQKIEANEYQGKTSEINKDVDEIIDQFKKKAKG